VAIHVPPDIYIGNIYRCPVCNKNWVKHPDHEFIKCSHQHTVGACCHIGEGEVSDEDAKTILRITRTAIQQGNSQLKRPNGDGWRVQTPVMAVQEKVASVELADVDFQRRLNNLQLE